MPPDTEIRDEFDEYLEEQLRNLAFARWWHRACASMPDKLCIDGREYARRQKSRRRKNRARGR
jgi:hypothetical protein